MKRKLSYKSYHNILNIQPYFSNLYLQQTIEDETSHTVSSSRKCYCWFILDIENIPSAAYAGRYNFSGLDTIIKLRVTFMKSISIFGNFESPE